MQAGERKKKEKNVKKYMLIRRDENESVGKVRKGLKKSFKRESCRSKKKKKN